MLLPADFWAVAAGSARLERSWDRRARELKITDAGRRTLRGITPAVEAAQRVILRGLTEKEAKELVRLRLSMRLNDFRACPVGTSSLCHA